MAAGADVVADEVAHGVVKGGLMVNAETGVAEECVDGFGVSATQEFTIRIGPLIPFGAGDVNGARRDQGDEHVLING